MADGPSRSPAENVEVLVPMRDKLLRQWGKEDMVVAVARLHLGSALLKADRCEEAAVELKECLCRGIAVCGARSPQVLGPRRELASALLRLGRFPECLEQWRAIGKTYKRHGPRSDLAVAHRETGRVLQCLGNTEGALIEVATALEIHAEGQCAPRDVSATKFLMGTLYNLMARHEDALASFQEALRLSKEGGAEETEVVAQYFAIGTTLIDMRRHPEALEAFTEAHGLCTSTKTSEAFKSMIESQLAHVRQRLGLASAEEALEAHGRAAVAAAWMPECTRTGTSVLQAMLLRDAGRLDEAEAHLRKVLASAATDALRGAVLSLLGTVLAASGRFDEAVAVHEESLALVRAAHGEGDFNLASSYANYGGTLRLAGRLEESEEMLRRGMDICASSCAAPKAALTAHLNMTLGEVHLARRDLGAAMGAFREAWGPFADPQDRVRVGLRLGDVYTLRLRYLDGLALYSEAEALAKQHGLDAMTEQARSRTSLVVEKLTTGA